MPREIFSFRLETRNHDPRCPPRATPTSVATRSIVRERSARDRSVRRLSRPARLDFAVPRDVERSRDRHLVEPRGSNGNRREREGDGGVALAEFEFSRAARNGVARRGTRYVKSVSNRRECRAK